MSNMHITPGSVTKTQARAGIVIASLFLLFGLGFGFVVLQETPDSEPGLQFLLGMFMLLWVIACVAMIVMYNRLLSKGSNPADNAIVDIHVDSGTQASKPEFADRLRELEKLKNEGLISAQEYGDKRAQIMDDKW